MRKSIWLVILVAFVVVSGATVESSAATKIRVGYIVDINMVPFFVAMGKGMFSKRGLEVEALEYISGNDSYTALMGGAMDIFQNMGANALAKFNSQGIPILMTRVWTLPHFKILVHKDATYKDIKELKGVSFAVTSYAGTTYALASMVFSALGMDIKKDVDVKTFPPAVMTVQLTRKDIASGILWEPLVAKALETNELKVLADPGELYINLFKKRFFHGATGCRRISSKRTDKPSAPIRMPSMKRFSTRWITRTNPTKLWP